MSESDFANFRGGSENADAANMAKDANVVIPSSPQVALEKKEKTPEVSCVGKVGIFFCLSASLLSLMGCVVYIGFWVHYNAEGKLRMHGTLCVPVCQIMFHVRIMYSDKGLLMSCFRKVGTGHCHG